MDKNEYTIVWNETDNCYQARTPALPEFVGCGKTAIEALEAIIETEKTRKKSSERYVQDIKAALEGNVEAYEWIEKNFYLFDPSKYEHKSKLIADFIKCVETLSLEKQYDIYELSTRTLRVNES